MKKTVSILLSLVILFSAFPLTVFAAGETPTRDYYRKITSTSEMVAGGRYLIVCESESFALDGSLGEDMDAPNNGIAFDFAGDVIESTDELDAASFDIDAGAGTIRSVSGWYIGSDDSMNSMETSETSDFVNQIGFDDGDFIASFQGVNASYQLQFNPQSGQKRFRFLKSEQNPVQLYMRVSVPVPYVDASGTAQTPVADYTDLDSGVTEWTNGWYVLKRDVSYSGRVAVKGADVNLILCDGATLNANKGIFIREGYSLTVWAQRNGSGALIAKGNKQDSHESAGIGASPECGGYWIDSYTYDSYDAGDLTVNGGVITATGAWHCAGIGSSAGRNSGTITINGGTVTATGGEGAAGIGGAYCTDYKAVVINGGTVTATGGDYGAGIGGGENCSGGTITISGGTVTAVGGYYGAGIGGGRKGGSGEITVGGGTIQAQGGKNSAGIGTGNSGEYGHITFNGGMVNASRGEGIVADGIGGRDCYIRFNYVEPGYDMRITTDSGYEGHAALFDKPFISVGLSKTRTYNGYTSTSSLSDTIIPKTAGIWDVTFDKNGGTGSMQSEEVPGGTYTLPACAFTAPSAEEPFICWAVKVGDADPVGKQPGDTVLVNADTTVTAIWKTDCTISFEGGGGSGTMDSAAVNAYDTYTLPENGFTAPAGKHFFAWEISAGDSSAHIMQPGEELLVTGSVTARALWTVSITSWAGLQTSIDNAQSGDTIALGQSLTAGSGDIRLQISGKAITLDLNGFTLDRNMRDASLLGSVVFVASGASLTVCDSSVDKTGTITGGYANKGGAFLNEGTLTIEGCVISDNHTNHANDQNRGGAIYNNGTLTMTGSTIRDGDGDDAGAIFNTADGVVTLTGVTISGNTSVNHGGGAIVNNGALALTDCTLTGNTSRSDGGAIWTNAGDKTVTVTNTTISGNVTEDADTRGGAIYIASGSVTVTGGTIAGNTAKDGGAVYNAAGGTLDMNGVSVHSNGSALRGGGAITNYGTAALTGCDVWNNEGHTSGGAIWSGGSDSASLTLTDCDISSNTCGETGGGICLRQGVLNTSGITLSNNSASNGAGLYVYEGASANLGGNGTVIYGNESVAYGGGIANYGDLRATAMLLVQENRAGSFGGGVYNGSKMSVQDIVTVQDNSANTKGSDLYLAKNKVLKLTDSLIAAQIGIDAEDREQVLTENWYEMQRNADPTQYFIPPVYYTVYQPDGSTELKIRKADDFPYDGTATVWAQDRDRNPETYKTGVNYTIHNLTSGNSSTFDSTTIMYYGLYDGVERYTRQGKDLNGRIDNSSRGTLEIDRSKMDTVQETGVYVEYSPFFYTVSGNARWGVELFPYSEEDPPLHCGDVTNNVGQNAYNTVTLTGSKNGSYTYQLHYGSVDGELRCAETSGGDFSVNAAVPAGTDTLTYGPYNWYLTGDAPAPGESVTLRIAALCCAASAPELNGLQVNLPVYMLTEWTNITITGTCSHSNGHLKAVAAEAPTCTREGNSAYWQCDVCDKCFSDAAAENEVTQESTVIPATGHSYAEPAAADWTWTKSGNTYTATVTVTCDNCGEAQTLTADVEKTAAADGAAVYTATASVDEQTFTAVMPTVYHSVTGYADANGNAVTADKATAAEGQTVTLTVTPASGYGLKTMTVTSGADGITTTAGANGTVTFTMPDGDIAVTAAFDLNYTVSVVSEVPEAVAVDKPVAFAGDTVTLTINPGVNWTLDTLTVTDADGDPVTVTNNTFVMPAKAVTVTADFYETYQMWIGGVQVTEKNKADILGDGSAVYAGSFTEGSLTLTNAAITAKHGSANIEVETTDLSLTIVLSGENTLSGAAYGIQFFGADLTVTGGGTLNATGAASGIFANQGLTFDDTTVSAVGIGGNGIDCSLGSLTILDSTVTSEGFYKGINAAGDIVIEDSDVTATTDNYFDGLYCEGSLTITDSSVYAEGQMQGLSVSDGTLTIAGDSDVTAVSTYADYPLSAVVAKTVAIGDGLGIAEPLNAHVKLVDGKYQVYGADGETRANRVVIGSAYAVNVTENARGAVTADKPYACAGDTVTLTITPNAHYALDTLTVTDADGDPVTLTNNTFVMPAKNVTVTASFYAVYPLWVGGVEVTDKNKTDILSDGSAVYEGDLTGGTLTLTDANITGLRNASNIYTFNPDGDGNVDFNLTIALSGDNTLSGGNYGVYFYSRSRLTITGSGSLTASGSTDGIYTGCGCQTLIDGTTVTASAAYNFGIECNSSPLTIKDSAVTSTGSYMGIDASDLSIVNSEVSATAEGISYALYSTGTMRITDSTVNATAASAYGICSGGNGSAAIIIENSSVSASSGNSDGIEAAYSGIMITDSTVETIGYYQGLHCDGTLTVNGNSTVTVKNRNAGYAALLAGDISLGNGLGISEPENAVIKTYSYKKAVYQSDGTTLADRVVISRVIPRDFQSVTIDDQIHLNLFLDLDFRDKTVNDVTITLNGIAYEAVGEKLTEGEYAGLYRYKVVMAPAQIADEIVVTIDGDAAPLETSVKAYCDYMNEHNSLYGANDVALATAILHYGQAANNVFADGVNVVASDIADISTMDKNAVQSASVTFTDGTNVVTGASFMALTKPEFRFYTSGIDEQTAYDYNQAGITVTMADASQEQIDALNARFVKKADKSILIEVTGITAENMDKTVTVTVTGLGTITFNGNAFAKAMAKSGSTVQQNLGAAIYNYGAAAKTCFGA